MKKRTPKISAPRSAVAAAMLARHQRRNLTHRDHREGRRGAKNLQVQYRNDDT